MINTTFLQNIHKRLFYLLILTLPTQLGLHFWPSWALVLGRRVDYLSPTLFLTDILIVLLLASWFVEPMLRIKNLRITKPWYSFLILCLFILANIWFASDRAVATWTWIKFCEFFFLGWYIVKTKPDPGRVIFFLSISVLYSSLIAIAQFVLQHSVGGILWFLGERTFTAVTPGIAQIPLCLPGAVSCPLALRPYATFPHPNVLGGFLAVMLPLILVSMCQPAGHRYAQALAGRRVTASAFNKVRIFFVMTFIAGLIALVLTFSRGAWAAGAVAIGLAIAGSKKLAVSRKSLLFIFGSVLLTAVYFLVTTRFSGESVVVRQQLAASAVTIWKSAPLVGAGLGNFLVALPQHLPSRTIYFLQPVHNIYLLLLSETGLVGLSMFAWFIFSIVRNYKLKLKTTEKKGQRLRSVILISLFSILVLGLIDHYPLSLQQGRLLLTLLIGLSIAY